MEVISFSNLNFGCADAEKELTRNPELFDDAFYDPENHLSKIIHGGHFLILGRKGTGKTAYSAKIRRLAEFDENVVAHASSLSRLNYSMFEDFSNGSALGGRRFSSTWEYLLLIEFLKMIKEKMPECQNEQINHIIDLLQKIGILTNSDLVHTIKTLRKTGIKINLQEIMQGELTTEKELSFIDDADSITEVIFTAIKTLYFGGKQLFLIIDGLDDSLRGQRFSSDIITGLLRAADYINDQCSMCELKLKVVILLRTDILNLCRDPDLTKICRDSAIRLNWNKDSLNEVVLKRIQAAYPHIDDYQTFWYTHFPEKFLNRDSMKVVFDITLYRPRDILQFFIECKTQTGRQLKYRFFLQDLYSIFDRYSTSYFLSEVQDELTGFIQDEVVNGLPGVFSKMGKSRFTVSEFGEAAKDRGLTTLLDPVELLEMLFEGGYVGQFQSQTYDGKNHLAFKHINTHARFDKEKDCLLHRGLRRAFNVT